MQDMYSSSRVQAIAPSESRHSKARMENTWLDFGGRVIQSSEREGGAGMEDLGWWGWKEEVFEGGAEMGLGRGWGLGEVVGCCPTNCTPLIWSHSSNPLILWNCCTILAPPISSEMMF